MAENNIVRVEKAFTGKRAARNLALLSLLAAPGALFLMIALKPNPRRMWAQRWPTILFAGLYQIALERCVELEGLENLPMEGPVILAGNHINKTAMDAMLLGSSILTRRGGLTKFVSIADPPGWMMKHFVRLMGEREGVLLPIQKGSTTDAMIKYLQSPANGVQPLLGIFPAGEASVDFESQMIKEWRTGAAVAALETNASIVPFFITGLPYHWGPYEMLKAVAQSIAGGKAFSFKVRLAPPIEPAGPKDDRNYRDITERVRQAVLRLAE